MINDPVFLVTENGISAPSYEEILEYVQEKARQIFGSDINVDADTQDGQLLAIFASAIHDTNAQAIGVYNSFNPSTAKGIALDTTVKVNGLIRRAATKSQADLLITGIIGTVIENGIAVDSFDRKWMLPETVTIPLSGQITVTANAENSGAIVAPSGTINRIGTPTLGWNTVTNPLDAIVGTSAESDEQLRKQQSISTMQPSVALWEGLTSSVLNLDGVTRVSGYNNDTSETTDEGIPPHSCALIVDGGDAQEIANTIYITKGQGTGTHGVITENIVDQFGLIHQIKFSRPTIVPIYVEITLTAGSEYSSTILNEIKNRVVTYINSIDIGHDVNLVRVLTSATQKDGVLDTSYTVANIKIGKSPSALTTTSVDILWNEAASCAIENVTFAGV